MWNTIFEARNSCFFDNIICRNFSIVDAIMSKLDRYANDLERIIEERTRELEEERRKSELLLYSVMPP